MARKPKGEKDRVRAQIAPRAHELLAFVGVVVEAGFNPDRKGVERPAWGPKFRGVPEAKWAELLKRFYPLAARLGDRESSTGYIFDDTGLTGTYDFKLEYPLGAFGFARKIASAASGSRVEYSPRSIAAQSTTISSNRPRNWS